MRDALGCRQPLRAFAGTRGRSADAPLLRHCEPTGESDGLSVTMKVLHIVANIDDRFGGPSRSVPLLCAHMEPHGVESAIFYCSRLEQDQNEVLSRRSIRTYRAPVSFSEKFHVSLGIGARLNGVFDEFNPDLVHIHSTWRHSAFEAFRIARKREIPHVVSPRSNYYPAALARSKAFKWAMRSVFADRMLKSASFVHATEPAEAEAIQLVGVSSKRIATIPNGVELAPALHGDPWTIASQASLPASPEERVMLFLARVHPRKGVDILLEAAAAVLPRHPDWVLLVAGPCEDAEYLVNLQRTVAASGLASRVRFCGMLRGEAKAAAFGVAELFVLPSLFENFGISIGEALAAELPVITTSATPWLELPQEGAGWIVPPNDVTALSQALEEALSLSTPELAAMGKAAPKLVERYSWPDVGAAMARRYREVLA